MGGKQVENPLEPVSTATSDQQVGNATDAETCPGSQVDPIVDLGIASLAKIAQVLSEGRETVSQEKFTAV